MKYRHLKTGRIYEHLGIVTNATSGQKMVLYSHENNKYVREEKEFNEKFIKDGQPQTFTIAMRRT